MMKNSVSSDEIHQVSEKSPEGQRMLADIITVQKDYFNSGQTLPIASRIVVLQQLKNVIVKNEQAICTALTNDFRKSHFETFLTEIAIVINEIEHMIRHLKKWGRATRLKTPLLFFPGKSYTLYKPYGVVLIIAPWNYPFNLSLAPAIGAIGAGNCVILKPSELAPSTSSLLSRLFIETIDPALATVVEGGVDVTKRLLRYRFDYLFFTGSSGVGRQIQKQIAEHLTPVTLELGGKNPCIVTSSSNLQVAAKRIIWGKLINCGQTCVAPDYLLVEKDISQQLVKLLIQNIQQFYGNDPENHPDYARIINRHHCERLVSCIDRNKVIYGGNRNVDSCYIQPTLLEGNRGELYSQGEIFGPLLSIIEVSNLSECVSVINTCPAPLVSYLFSKNNEDIVFLREAIQAGALVVNDVVSYLAHSSFPFGGVGASGMGQYHGKSSFTTFSQLKPVMMHSFKFDIALRYPPYKGHLKVFKKIISLLNKIDSLLRRL